MAHLRRPLKVALGLNTVVLVVEIVAGVGANSLSLMMDGVHNLSDELALLFLVLAYTRSAGLSGRFLRLANLFNSIGLITISGFLIWQAVGRLLHPMAILGWVPIVAGLIGAACNWGVAQTLRGPGKEDVSIRFAYVHNFWDTLVSLVPVASGIATLVTGSLLIDPLLALVIAAVILVSTAQTVKGSHRELWWPEKVICAHH